MKKMTFILVSLILVLVLVACGESIIETGVTAEGVDLSASDASAITAKEVESSASELKSDYENALRAPMQLAVGTLMLEDTELVVDSDQAAQLLPLWKAARSLGSSDTAAAEEVGAVYNQIQETMTPEQIAAIAAMQLRREDMFEAVQKLGLAFGPGSGGGEGFTPEQQATVQAARASGQGFPGGFGGRPSGGGGPGGGAGGPGLSPEARETAIAERGGPRGAGSGVNPAFIEAIITLLEGKSG
jgi:hypothetical protein